MNIINLIFILSIFSICALGLALTIAWSIKTLREARATMKQALLQLVEALLQEQETTKKNKLPRILEIIKKHKKIPGFEQEVRGLVENKWRTK